MHSPYIKAYLAIFLAVTIWGTQTVAGRVLMTVDGAYSALQMTFIRQLMGAVALLPLFAYGVWQQRHALLAQWDMVLKTSFFGMFCYSTFSLYGLANTTALNASIMAAVAPAITVIVARLFFGQKIQWVLVPWVVLSFLGALVIISRGDWQVILYLDMNIGDFSMLMASTMWAVYTMCVKQKSPEIGTFELLLVNMSIGVLVSLFTLPWLGQLNLVRDIWTVDYTLLMLFSALIAGAFSIGLYSRAVPVVGGVEASVWLNLIPAVGGILAILILSEKFHIYHIMGSLMIAFSVYKIVMRSLQDAKKLSLQDAKNL